MQKFYHKNDMYRLIVWRSIKFYEETASNKRVISAIHCHDFYVKIFGKFCNGYCHFNSIEFFSVAFLQTRDCIHCLFTLRYVTGETQILDKPVSKLPHHLCCASAN